MHKRWLFIWRDMSDSKEVDRMIARFPREEQAEMVGEELEPTKQLAHGPSGSSWSRKAWSRST